MSSLSSPQQQLYDWLVTFIQKHGYAPSVRQMMQAMGLKSPAPVQSRLKYLKQKGFIDWEEGKARTLRLLPQAASIPLQGVVQSDGQIERSTDTCPVLDWQNLLPAPNCHALRVVGSGLANAHILDGDLLIFQQPSQPAQVNEGSWIAARVPGYGTRLKSLQCQGDVVLLSPLSNRDQPLSVPAAELGIQGVVVGLWRQCPAPP
jgi:repressor LexA